MAGLLADLCTTDFLSLEVVSDPHKVKVGGDKDGRLFHQVTPVLW